MLYRPALAAWLRVVLLLVLPTQDSVRAAASEQSWMAPSGHAIYSLSSDKHMVVLFWCMFPFISHVSNEDILSLSLCMQHPVQHCVKC
jgi:hypothetical protein